MNLCVGLYTKCFSLFRKFIFNRSVSLGTIIVLHAGIPITALAQTDSLTNSSRKVDYSPAINELLKIGFPNLKGVEGAKYVKLNDRNLEWTCSGFGFSSHMEGGPTLSGNGFYIPSKDKTKPGRFIYLGGCELTYLEANKNSTNYNSQNSTRGTMVDGNLKKDLESIHKWAQTAATKENFRYNDEASFSVALGFATLAHQTGLKKEATELLKTLFLNHDEPEKIIDRLITNLASRECNQSYQEFTLTKDWSKYHKSLLKLQKNYPRGWKKHLGLEILIPQVLSRVNKEPVPTPTIKDHTFSPEITKIIEATALPAPVSNDYYGNDSLFLINRPAKNNKVPPFMRLTQHGMDGFIAIVSLIGDGTLMSPGSSHGGMSYSGYSSYNDDTSPEEAYRTLTKPPTRGETAFNMVKSTLPHDYQTLSDLDPEELKAFAISWWKEHRNDSKIELTKHYLAEGNQSHTHMLIRSMLQQNTAESRELFELSVLNSQRPSNLSDSVKTYVKRRKAKAKDFLLKYQEALVKETKESDSSSISYQVQSAGGVEKYIASLMNYTEVIDTTKLLKKLAEKDAKIKQIMELLLSTYEGQNLSEYVNPIIQIAANKEQPIQQMFILNALLEFSYRSGNESSSISSALSSYMKALVGGRPTDTPNQATPTDNVASPEKLVLSQTEQLAWKKLLFSDGYAQGMKISTLAGMLFDKYVHPNSSRMQFEYLRALGVAVTDELIRNRSKAILAGSELTPLPNPDQVTEERIAEILKSLQDSEPSKQRQVVLALNHSERIKLSYSNTQSIFATGQEYIQGFGPLAGINQTEHLDQLKLLLKPIIGRKKEADTSRLLADIFLKNAATFANHSVVITPSRSLPGLDIVIAEQTLSPSEQMKSAQKDLLADKISSFSTISTYDNNTGEQATLIITKDTQPTVEELKTVSAQNYLLFSSFTKASVLKKIKEKEATKEEREKLINELIILQPYLKDHIEQFNELSLEQLKQYKEQLQNQ